MRYIWLLAILFCTANLYPQVQNELVKRADDHFVKGEYAKALEVYLDLNDLAPDDPQTISRIGICYFETNQLGKAKNNLKLSLFVGVQAPSESFLYLGKVLHEQQEFENAIKQYKEFLRRTDTKHPLRSAVKADILRCAKGINVIRLPALAKANLLNVPLNSSADELKPLPSPNYSDIIYFSSNRARTNSSVPSSLDMYSIVNNDSSWENPLPLGLVINSPYQELPQSFNENGNHLYFFRGETLSSGDILVDTFAASITEKNMLFPTLFDPIHAWEGDCDLQFFNDTIMLFASRRPGGFGGLDLYVSHYSSLGWSNPQNLGPTINSAYDERSPHLAPDGRTLYFSTDDARRSIGGLDILKSFFLDKTNKWTPPQNLGLSFNSASDDTHFVLQKDGKTALFVSNRKSGLGGFDIYMAEFHESIGEQLYPNNPPTFSLAAQQKQSPDKSPQVEDKSAFFDTTPLFFDNPFSPLPEDLYSKLDVITDWLLTYPSLQLTFVAHADEADRGLFPTKPVSQQISDHLKGKSIPFSNVRFMHGGNSFPLSKGPNRRVEIYVANPKVLPVLAKESMEGKRSFQAVFLKRAMEGLMFQILIPVNDDTELSSLFRSFKNGMLLEYPASETSYFSPSIYLSWDAAVEAEKEILKLGYPDVQLKPFLFGWEIDTAHAEKHYFEFPELKGFLERNQIRTND